MRTVPALAYSAATVTVTSSFLLLLWPLHSSLLQLASITMSTKLLPITFASIHCRTLLYVSKLLQSAGRWTAGSKQKLGFALQVSKRSCTAKLVVSASPYNPSTFQKCRHCAQSDTKLGQGCGGSLAQAHTKWCIYSRQCKASSSTVCLAFISGTCC